MKNFSKSLVLSLVLSTSAFAQDNNPCDLAKNPDKDMQVRIEAGEVCKLEREMNFCKQLTNSKEKGNCAQQVLYRLDTGFYKNQWLQELSLLKQFGQ